MCARTLERLLIRPNRAADVSRLHEIDGICFPPDICFSRSELLFYLKQPDAIARVAELNNAVVGFVLGRVEDGWAAHVMTLDVLPEARRKRIGTSLMNALHEAFQQHRAAVSVLEVSAENQSAQRFYEGLHYVYVETIAGFYNGKGDAYRMVKELGD
jgi:ribosomal-protein-alanine N-acetyltransferase